MKVYEKVIIIICAVAVALVFGLWGKKQLSGEKTVLATEAVSEEKAETPSSEAAVSNVAPAETVAPAPTEVSKQETPSQSDTPAQNDTPEAPAEETQAETPSEEAPASAVPSGTDAILAAFNKATSDAVSSAAFTKTKKSTLTSYTIEGDSLAALKKVGGSIYESLSEKTVKGTLNVGEETETATKGGGSNLMNVSTLAASDVQSASVSDNGSSYTVNILVNDSENPGTQSIPMEKFSKDFLTLELVQQYGSENALTVISAEATITKTNIKAEIDTATGQFKSYAVTYDYAGALTDCTYKFLGKNYTGLHGSGALAVEINYSDFAY